MARRDAPKVPSSVERFLKALVVTAKAVALYPPASNIPQETAVEAARLLGDVLERESELRIVVTKDGLFHRGVACFPDNPAYANFAGDLYHRHLADIRFHAGAVPKDIVAFLSVLQHTPAEIRAAGGFESRLWDAGVSAVTVTEAQVAVVDAEEGDGPEEFERTEIDRLLRDAYGARPRDQITIARFITQPGRVCEYLTETFRLGGESGLVDAGERFAELAEIAYEAAGVAGRYELMQDLAQALADLDPEIRHQLLVGEVLPEARTNEALANVIRQMDIDAVCSMLVSGRDAEGGEAENAGIARAIRNLALISMADRDEVLSAAGAAMTGAGMSAESVGSVLEMAAPSQLTVRELPERAGEAERPADTIFKLMDLAPLGEKPANESSDDPGVAELVAEARRGITDGDVVMALVTLAGLDVRETEFACTMSMLEDTLDLLIERGELDIAADAADALAAAAEQTNLTPEQRKRLSDSVRRFSKPSDIRTVAHALRIYEPGSTEHEAARRLLEALGELAIEPLLEQLADEPDMAVRKSIIDVLSQLAPRYISELGLHMGDQRWYVVRNVVGVLGSTKSSAILPYLERTLRHPEPRVRRETLRALSGIGDRLAHEMMIQALSDADAQNVQLAARYLGASGVRGAVPMLEQVARGEGRGNRDTGPRVEAIEALGKLGAVEAALTLEVLAGKRAIVRQARVRELRAAAEAALAQIRAQGGAS